MDKRDRICLGALFFIFFLYKSTYREQTSIHWKGVKEATTGLASHDRREYCTCTYIFEKSGEALCHQFLFSCIQVGRDCV